MAPPVPSPAGIAPGVSVIICCFNSAARLPETLRHLAAQQVRADLPWELLMVVDRATTDDTVKVIESFQPHFAPGQLRLVWEARRGLGAARLTAAREARYEFLSFVDDDNWVPPDWVEIVHRTFTTLPQATAFGGRGDAVYEREPPPAWFKDFCAAYAVGEQYRTAGEVTDQPTSLLWGAGLCIRRSAFLALLDHGFEFICSEKLGPELWAFVRSRPCEDTELCFALRALGGRFFYVPELTYKHYMAADRLTWPVVRRMFRGHGRSGVFCHLLKMAADPQLPARQLARERSWRFQAARALWRLTRMLLRHPASLLTNAEGSAVRLQADALRGQLEMLLRLRGRHDRIFDEQRKRYLQPSAPVLSSAQP
ncbi:MAG: glycosyltransferase [Limisphaerales bacterium]